MHKKIEALIELYGEWMSQKWLPLLDFKYTYDSESYYNPTFRQFMKSGGVYLIGDEIYSAVYVGESKYLSYRIRDQMNPKKSEIIHKLLADWRSKEAADYFSNKKHFVKILEVKDDWRLRVALENLAIYLLEPKVNKYGDRESKAN